jgi:hypothetical protein
MTYTGRFDQPDQSTNDITNIETTDQKPIKIGILAAEGGMIWTSKNIVPQKEIQPLTQLTFQQLSELRAIAKSDSYDNEGMPKSYNDSSRKQLMEELERKGHNRF